MWNALLWMCTNSSTQCCWCEEGHSIAPEVTDEAKCIAYALLK